MLNKSILIFYHFCTNLATRSTTGIPSFPIFVIHNQIFCLEIFSLVMIVTIEPHWKIYTKKLLAIIYNHYSTKMTNLKMLFPAYFRWWLTLYSIIAPFDTFETPVSYRLFENIMENRAFAPLSKCSIFHNIFKSIQNLTSFCLEFFSMLPKNRKWCHDLNIAYGVKGPGSNS